MKFTPPVIAAISAGSLALLTLIVLLILYFQGFFEKPSVKQSGKKDEEVSVFKTIRKFVGSDAMCEALKSASFDDPDIVQAFERWKRGPLKAIKKENDFQVIFDAFIESSKVMLKRMKDCGDDKAAFGKALKESDVVFYCLDEISAHSLNVFDLGAFARRADINGFLQRCENKGKKDIGRKVVTSWILMTEIEKQDPKNALPDSQRTYNDFLKRANEALEALG